ncbi:cytochrome C oxidase subunit IV family protein [bacterium]|nr:cytochrome C oxidase subunit IV family protein [bacterium]
MDNETRQDDLQEHLVPHSTQILVWVALLMFTGGTVWVASLHLGRWSTVVAVLIASCKGSLVLLYFMGLKYERPIFRYMFLTTIIVLGVFIGGTYMDVLNLP